jgi:hypothetical protein
MPWRLGSAKSMGRKTANGGPSLPCAVVDREALRYFFNGLPRPRRGAIRAHLAWCLRCRRKLQVFEAVWVRKGSRRRPERA